MAFMGKERQAPARPITVSELNSRARDLLEETFPDLWVRGEVSRPTRAASGHLYFGLKDAGARIDAVVWAGQARGLAVALTDGLEVLARGQLTLYAPQGRYQLVCSEVQPAGEGALRAAFLRLKAKLDAEGLTDPARKRRLPALPRAVGLVTSPTGAAIQDLLTVILRRFPPMRIILCPVRVQGEGAAREIAEGLARLARRPEVDVIVVGRGGGSIEDLWVFNDEGLARAIAACPRPVVSAVGHEIDVTLADLVADARAPTPTAAGEMVVPDHAELCAGLARLGERLGVLLGRAARAARADLDALGRRPGLRLFPRRLEDLRQGLDLAERALVRSARRGLLAHRSRLDGLGQVLAARSPRQWIRERRGAAGGLGARAEHAARTALAARRHALAGAAAALDALNPLAVLARGFTVTRVDEGGGRLRLLRSGDLPPEGALLRTTLAAGQDLLSRVEGQGPRTLPEAAAQDGGAASPDEGR